jgi:hypothetical protein
MKHYTSAAFREPIDWRFDQEISLRLVPVTLPQSNSIEEASRALNHFSSLLGEVFKPRERLTQMSDSV